MVTILWIHLIVPPLSDELLRLRFLHGILESLSNKLKTAAVSTPTIFIFVHFFASLCKTTQLRLTEGFFGKRELMTVKSVIITAEPC